jgi:hypothetical protein
MIMAGAGFAVRGAAATLLGLVTLALAACGGAGGPPAQTPAVQVALTGVQMDGTTTSSGGVTAKGAQGTQRTTAPLGGSISYSVSVDALTAPYMVAGAGYTVATAAGQANLTPLTTLLTSALFGQDAPSAFTSFGPGATTLIGRVTDANITAAQADVTDFLQNTVGVTVKSGDASFITTPFRPVAGDSMHDTLVALDARVAALGSDAYNALVTAFVEQQHLCLLGKVVVTIAGKAANFCAATKSAAPEDADPSVLDHVYTATAGGVLTLSVRDRTVLSAGYTTAAGAAYACSGTACSGIAVGAAASDLTRTITFDAAALAGSSGGAALTGSLTSAVPGVVLPVLPCSDNRFFFIQPDRSVIADCVDISAGAGTFGIPATFANPQGSTQYGTYPFVNFGSSNANYPAAVQPTTVSVVLDGSTVVSVTVTRQQVDPVTGLATFDLDYKCRASACNGVAVSAPTINSDFGFDAQIRSMTFDNTRLALVNADGSLSTTVFASLKASFTGIFMGLVDTGGFFPILATDCASFADKVATAPADESTVFGSCSGIVGGSIGSTPLPGGGLGIVMNTFGSGDVTVDTDAAGTVIRVLIAFNAGESFGCTGSQCAGVTVSGPDAGGSRQVTLTGTVLNIAEPDGYPTGARTATADGSFTVPPLTASASRGTRGR